ncbi:MAG: helix-turn-helix transcriptional regulator [Mycobacterium sp.]
MSTATPEGESPLERVGRAVADRRVEVGFETQRELADAAGLSLNTAALLERGKSFPHRANRIKFEDALGWPRGTLDALRRGAPVPDAASAPAPERVLESVSAAAAARTDLQALTIAKAVAAIAATCTKMLVSQRGNAQAQATLRDLDDQLLQLESLIAASLPHVARTSFSETMSALAQLHEYRDVIRDAAQAAETTSEVRRSGGEPRTRMASAKS